MTSPISFYGPGGSREPADAGDDLDRNPANAEGPPSLAPAGADSDHEDSNADATFEGDVGTLPPAARRAFIHLLAGPSIDARRNSKLWADLLLHKTVLRSRLQDLYLDLVLDAEQQVAFTRQIVAPELDIPILLRRAALTFIDSVLVLFLRQKLTQADAQGERAVLDLSEMQEHLRVYERSDNADQARFERQITAAIDKAKKLNLLHQLRSSDARYEVSPTLKLLFPAEAIEQLTRAYDAHLAATNLGDTGTEKGARGGPEGLGASVDGPASDEETF